MRHCIAGHVVPVAVVGHGDVVFRLGQSKKNGLHNPEHNGTNIPEHNKNRSTSDTV
jgi:hypothetical protein